MEQKIATQNPERDDTDPVAVVPGEGEATVLHRPPPADEPQPARLVVLAGPRIGLEVPVTEQEVTIGRGAENLVVLPDISVSRHHALLRREKGGYVLLDQASGNGTRLNGKPVARSPLRSGDRIALGDSLVEFVDPNEATAPKAAGSTRPEGARREVLSRRAIYYLAAGAVLAVFFAVAGWRKHQRDVAERLAAQQAAETRALAAERFSEAKSMLAQGRWSEALAKLRIAAELNPRDREIARYVKKADDEAPYAAALADARGAIGRKDFAAAQTALATVPEDSVLAESVRDVRAALAQVMDEAVRDASKRAEANDAAGARERLAPVLAADPNRADAVAVQEALSRETARQPIRKRRVAAARATPAPPVARGAVEKAYLAGDLAAAIDLAERQSKRGNRVLRDLRGFDASYREGFDHLQAGRVREAIAALERANGFDRAVAGRSQGPLGNRVRKALSSLHTQMALDLTETTELPKAAAQLRSALAEDPSNERAQKELQAAMARAHEEYMRGYVAKDSDPDLARVSFRIAAETLPPSDEEAQKARRWLDKLSGASQKGEGD